jgi:transposase InsO family protein
MRTQDHSLTSICNYIGISRQSYHKRLTKQRSKEQLYQSLEQVVLSNRQLKSRVGLRTIYYKEKLSSLLGVNQFEQQMSALGYSLKPYRSYLKTTDSRGHFYKFDNLISGIDITRENQVIVGDITYYQNAGKLYYIFHFQDYYTLEIKGLIGDSTMRGLNAEKCLRQIFAYNKQGKYDYQLKLHTDAGVQYRSHKFQSMLRKAQIRPSHAGNCFENGLSERANGIVKNEYLIDYDIRNVSQLNRVLKEIKYQANEVWPSKTLEYRTPKEFAQWARGKPQADRPIKTVKIVQ